MRHGNFWQKRFQVQLEHFFQLLGVFVSRRTIVTVVNPQHRNFRLHLRCEMQNNRFIRTKIRGDNRAAFRLRDGPLHNFERRFISQLGVGIFNLFSSHFKIFQGRLSRSARSLFLPLARLFVFKSVRQIIFTGSPSIVVSTRRGYACENSRPLAFLKISILFGTPPKNNDSLFCKNFLSSPARSSPKNRRTAASSRSKLSSETAIQKSISSVER